MTMPHEPAYWTQYETVPMPATPAMTVSKAAGATALELMRSTLAVADHPAHAQHFSRRPVEHGYPLPVIGGRLPGVVRAIVDTHITFGNLGKGVDADARTMSRRIAGRLGGTSRRESFDARTDSMIDELWYRGGRALYVPAQTDPPVAISRDVVYFRGLPEGSDALFKVASEDFKQGKEYPGVWPLLRVGMVYREEVPDGGHVLTRIAQAEAIRPREEERAKVPSLQAMVQGIAAAVRAARLLPGGAPA